MNSHANASGYKKALDYDLMASVVKDTNSSYSDESFSDHEDEYQSESKARAKPKKKV
jgi:hypothetical protein